MAWKTLKKALGTTNGEPLTAASTKCRRVLIQAQRSNAGLVTIGDSNVAADRGIELIKPVTSAHSFVLDLGALYGNDIDLSLIYAKGTANDIVCVLYDEY